MFMPHPAAFPFELLSPADEQLMNNEGKYGCLRDIYKFFFFQNLYIGNSTFSCHYRVEDFQRAQEHKSSSAPKFSRFDYFLRLQRK